MGEAACPGRAIPSIPSAVFSTAPLTMIAQTIQLSLSPAFMLTGIGALLGVLTGRLSRVIDRSRVLEGFHEVHVGPEHDRHVVELKFLAGRMATLNLSIFAAVSSAVLNCLVVVLLFVAGLAHLNLGSEVAVCFILAMLALVTALVSFLIDVRSAIRSIRVRPELLQ